MSRSIAKTVMLTASIVLAAAGIAHARTDAETKAIVLKFNEDAFTKHDAAAAAADMSADFFEHHPPQGTPEGTHDQFLAMIGRSSKMPRRPGAGNGPPPPDLVLVSGDYGLLMTKMTRPDPTKPGSTYDADWFDLFRVNDQGKVAEHWDSGTKRAMAPGGAAGGPPPG